MGGGGEAEESATGETTLRDGRRRHLQGRQAWQHHDNHLASSVMVEKRRVAARLHSSLLTPSSSSWSGVFFLFLRIRRLGEVLCWPRPREAVARSRDGPPWRRSERWSFHGGGRGSPWLATFGVRTRCDDRVEPVDDRLLGRYQPTLCASSERCTIWLMIG